jgi:hypothetical protein
VEATKYQPTHDPQASPLMTGDLFLDILQNEKRGLICFEFQVNQSDKDILIKEYSNAF